MVNKSFLYKNIFSQEEVNQILNFFKNQPIATKNYLNFDKNLDYHIEDSFAHTFIKPKIQALIGDHHFENGSYKECIQPYTIHIDNYAWWDDTYTFKAEENHQCFLLIPLVTSPKLRTVTFDIFYEKRYEMGEPMPSEWLGIKNTLDLEDFSHCKPETREQIQYLPVDRDLEWQAGDVIRWHKNQLHCSTDFAKYDLVKKFVLLGLA